MLKKLLFLFVLCHLMTNFLNAVSAEIKELIPLKKPIQTKEETQKKLSVDILKPLPKPIPQTNKKN